jgi:hypothetical protein
MIRKFIAIAALCLASTTVFATVAMAAPAPDICVLDLSQPVTLDHAIVNADMSCAVLVEASIMPAGTMPSGDEDEAAGPLKLMLAHANPSGSRLHFDPGRAII